MLYFYTPEKKNRGSDILGVIKKLSSVFILTLLCGAPKDFMKAFKIFIKPFWGTTKCENKNLIFVSTQLSEMHRMLRVKWVKKNRYFISTNKEDFRLFQRYDVDEFR